MAESPIEVAVLQVRKRIDYFLLPLMQLAEALNKAGLTDGEIAAIADDPDLLETVAKTVRDVVRGAPSPRIHFKRSKERMKITPVTERMKIVRVKKDKDAPRVVSPPDISAQDILDGFVKMDEERNRSGG